MTIKDSFFCLIIMLPDAHTKKRFVLGFVLIVLVLVSTSVHIFIFFYEIIAYY